MHALEVACICKGKSHKRYEFGCKASFAATSREGFVIGAQALHGNPYDGHTLSGALAQVERLSGAKLTGDIDVDRGYRGHDYEGSANVTIVGRRFKGLPPSVKRWMKRCSAIEPTIGHMKSDGRLGRNFLTGRLGDRLNTILSGCGHNLRLMLAKLGGAWRRGRGRFFFFVCWTLLALRSWASWGQLQPAQPQVWENTWA